MKAKEIEELSEEDLMELWPAIGGTPHLFEYGKDELKKVLIDGECADDDGNAIGLSLGYYTMAAIVDTLRERGFQAPIKNGLSEQEIRDIEAMADKTCHLSNLERRLIKEAAVFLSDNLLSFPKKDLKFTQANVSVWLEQYKELSKNF